ncbi:MAG TPA: ATP-binding SpoIIE family protein phosphatase [Acetobacteraceae bacterium]|jgi:anti-sigma regulatory factor (Ser/Thr protein kinase)
MFTAVADPSQVAEARRLVSALAGRIGLPRARIDQIAIVVTELATNILKHGGGGHIHAVRCDDAEGTGLELLALDRGPGMADVNRCMQDGYSTAGSLGNGLGAIARLADTIRIYSQPGQGSAIMVRFIERPPPGARTLLGAVLAVYPGEQVCGDDWTWKDTVNGRTVMLVDGSGHGMEAARAADIAIRAFSQDADATCEALVERIHRTLAPTRGAALAVARIDTAARVVRFVGLGNISAVLVNGGKARHMVSHNGTAGHVAPRIREFTYEFSGEPLVIMHSDGLTSRWDLAGYPGLAAQHPSLVAGVLLRDNRRGRDDASVVAMRAVP